MSWLPEPRGWSFRITVPNYGDPNYGDPNYGDPNYGDSVLNP
jgi:hypothetical protein